jgi:membrane protease subunit HflK
VAWNEPGNGQRDPWGKNRRPGGKPSLDSALKGLKSTLGKLGQGPGSILTGVLVLLLVGLLLSSYTIIDTRQVGVVLRFGQYSRTLGPGFHLKLPQPIEAVNKVEATRVRSVNDTVSMLTRDENIITVDFTVQYQVNDARKYLFSLNDPDGSVQAAAEAAVRGVIGGSDMDQILSAAGANLVTQAQQTLQKTLDGYNAGLSINEVSFQNVSPPKEVKDAFDDVNKAREDKQSIENGALAYANKVVPVARGDAAVIAQQAEGYKAERIANAQGDTARFNQLLKEYKLSPEVTRHRLYLETMEQVMAHNPKVIDTTGGRNIINLPFGRTEGASPNSTDAGTVGAMTPGAGDSNNSTDKSGGSQP